MPCANGMRLLTEMVFKSNSHWINPALGALVLCFLAYLTGKLNLAVGSVSLSVVAQCGAAVGAFFACLFAGMTDTAAARIARFVFGGLAIGTVLHIIFA